MPPTGQTAIDPRGYVFQLPTLGLPDLAGQWINIKVAIGTEASANAALQDPNVVEAPRRYACDRYAIADLEYEGAVYVIPLCAPEKQPTETEVFTLRVRRHLAKDFPSITRIKVPDGQGRFPCFPPPGRSAFEQPFSIKGRVSTASTPPTEADEDAFWENEFGPLIHAYYPARRPFGPDSLTSQWGILHTSPEAEGIDIKKMKDHGVAIFADWFHTPDDAFNDFWYLEALEQTLIPVLLAKIPIDRALPFMDLRGRITSTGEGCANEEEEVVFDYSLSFLGGNAADAQTRQQLKWKEVPRHAWKPEYELTFVNQVRRAIGKRALKEKEFFESRRKDVATSRSASTSTRDAASLRPPASPSTSTCATAGSSSSGGSIKAQKATEKGEKAQQPQSQPQQPAKKEKGEGQEVEVSELEAMMSNMSRLEWVERVAYIIWRKSEGYGEVPE